MSLEFRLRVAGDWPPAIVTPETFMRRLPMLACLAPYGLLATSSASGTELRFAGNVSGMPDVQVIVEDHGFYLADNHGELGNHVLAELVRYLCGSYSTVTVEEL